MCCVHFILLYSMSTGRIPNRLRLEYPRLRRAEEGKQSPAYSNLFWLLLENEMKEGGYTMNKEVGTTTILKDVFSPSFSFYNITCNIHKMTDSIFHLVSFLCIILIVFLISKWDFKILSIYIYLLSNFSCKQSNYYSRR